MPAYAALLRAINVGGTGKLAMSELRQLCTGLGFKNVATYIQSGNVVFSSELPAAAVQQQLEQALAKKLGKPCGVLVRTATQLRSIIKNNPFTDAEPNRVIVLLLDSAPAKASLQAAATPAGEQLAAGKRDVYIHYPQGQGVSKLKLPEQKVGTGRNLNSLKKILELLAER